MDAYIILGVIIFSILFVIYLGLDFAMIKGGANAFFEKWVRKTLWIWLPFYALQRLIKEVIFKK
jgi:hypothetical protein